MAFSLPYFDVRFVGAILVNARPKRNISATIVADVKRFSHQINMDEVFGTHRRAKASNPSTTSSITVVATSARFSAKRSIFWRPRDHGERRSQARYPGYEI